MFTLVIALCVIACAFAFDYKQSVGFGVQRLQAKRSGRLTTTCEGIPEQWFADAVVDNFAPVEQQTKWAGQGQRFWTNSKSLISPHPYL